MSEERSSLEEREQAEALARALDGLAGGAEAPSDALEAAGLLRVSQAPELSDARAEVILSRIQTELGQARARLARPWLRWLVPAGSLAAAAAAVLLLMLPAGPASTGLPRPGQALLRVQAEVAGGSAEAAARLADGMRDYRRELYARLGERYRSRP